MKFALTVASRSLDGCELFSVNGVMPIRGLAVVGVLLYKEMSAISDFSKVSVDFTDIGKKKPKWL